MTTEKIIISETFIDEVKKTAREKGIDPNLINREEITAERKNDKIHIAWKDMVIKVPAPSQETIDSWFKENGKVIAGAILTLGAVTVGGAIVIASAAVFKD